MSEKPKTDDRAAQAGLPCSDLLGIPSITDKSGFNAHDKTEGKEEWLTPSAI